MWRMDPLRHSWGLRRLRLDWQGRDELGRGDPMLLHGESEMSKTKIEWATDVWNPTTGCTKVSAGCKNCYAETMHRRLRAMGQAKYHHDFGEVRCHPEELTKPLRWRKPRKIFVDSMSDLFHADIPFEFIAAVFGVMAATPHHTYMVLTKRLLRALMWFRWVCNDPVYLDPWIECHMHALEAETDAFGPTHSRSEEVPGRPWPIPNVILMASVEDQATADDRISFLLQCPAASRGISLEPMLGPVDVDPYVAFNSWGALADKRETFLDWVVVGAESGPKARPMELEWAESVVKQCKAAGVACFVKQLHLKDRRPPGSGTGKPWVLSKEPGEWPENLRVREMPR